MKEDYLWDKTGTDAEIEMLESALQEFRYQETAAPVLPAKVLVFEKEAVKKPASRRLYPLALQIAACLVIGITALFVWLQISKSNVENKETVAEAITPQKEETQPNVSSVSQVPTTSDKKANLPVENPVRIEKIKASVAPRAARPQKIAPVLARYKEPKKQNIKPATPDVALTAEEKYAYNQLILALSITSSKLNMVREKIAGVQ